MTETNDTGKTKPVENNNENLIAIKKIIELLQLFLPVTLAKRLVAMILLAAGVPTKRVTELSGLCDRSTRGLLKSMREEDVENLLVIKRGSGRKSKISGLETEILKELEQNNYHTRQQIADMIKEKFQVQISVSAVGKFLKKNGIKRLKNGSLPAKADTQKQRVFYDDVPRPLTGKAERDELVLLFMDASHFVMGCDFLGYIYGKVRRFVLTFSGRKRYNVLGAIDYATKKVLTVTNESYITATEVCEMLRKISAEYAGKAVHLVLDNARYQKCQAVTELAAQLGIELNYVPPYSPNLNLIERLWKFVKGELRSRYYDDFGIFQQKIDSIIESTSGENKDKITKLIGQKVQLFDELCPVCKNTFVQKDQQSGEFVA